jgi:hypothetical protein
MIPGSVMPFSAWQEDQRVRRAIYVLLALELGLVIGFAAVYQPVKGHQEVRVGGLVISWLAVTRNPGWWPSDLPVAG